MVTHRLFGSTAQRLKVPGFHHLPGAAGRDDVRPSRQEAAARTTARLPTA